jgi:hypothetical protein
VLRLHGAGSDGSTANREQHCAKLKQVLQILRSDGRSGSRAGPLGVCDALVLFLVHPTREDIPMTTIRRVLCLIAGAASLGACGSADDGSRAAPPPVEDTAFGDMVGSMERARAVEDVTLQHKESLDRAVRKSEGPVDN